MEIKYLKTKQDSSIISWNTTTKTLHFTVNGKIYKARVINSNKNRLELYIFNFKKTFKINLFNPKQFLAAQKTEFETKFEDKLASPISGRVIKINVKENEFVRKNQTLLIIESMKMENEIKAKYDAFIKTVSIVTSDLVKQDQILIKFEKRGKKDGTAKSKNAKTSVSNR